MKSESEVTESCPTLRDPKDCSLPGSSVHGIFQARVLEWGAIAFSVYYMYEATNVVMKVSETKNGRKSNLFIKVSQQTKDLKCPVQRSLHKPLTLLHQRADKLITTITEN